MAMLQQQIEGWDGECVVVRFDRPTGTWIFIAVHDRTLGMAMGGCRMKVYPAPVDGLRDAQRLAERGIVDVPDFIINAGGAVAHGILEFLDWPDSEVESRVRRIGETVGEVLDAAAADGLSPRVAAVARAQAVIEGGKGTRA